MKADIQPSRLRQLPLFSETIEVPRWHELNESTQKDVVRRLAQLIGHFHEIPAGQPAQGSGAHNE